METVLDLQTSKDFSLVCSECGSSKLIPDKINGEKVCSQCGYVTQEVMVDHSREWRAFTVEESNNRSRVGMPRSLSIGDYGLHTLISKNKSIKGRISSEEKYKLLRLSRWQSKIVDSRKTRNLNLAMGALSNICSHMHISRNVKEQTALYYRKALNADLVKGRSIEAIVAASLYAACRLTETQRSLKEIAEFTSCDYKVLARSYRLIYDKLGLDVPRQKAQNRIPKIADEVGLEQDIQRGAIRILKKAESEKITAGKSPSGLAAAALYAACMMSDTKCTQKDIAFAAGITEVTIRNRYKDLVQELDLKIGK